MHSAHRAMRSNKQQTVTAMLRSESREPVNVGAKRRRGGGIRERLNVDGRPSFDKYVAVPRDALTSSRAPPLIPHDQVDRSEWIRVQLAVDSDRHELTAFG